MIFRSILTILTIVIGLAGTPDAYAASIVFSDDFSNPWGGGFTPYYPNMNMGKWSVGHNGVELIGTYWQAPTIGGGSVDLDRSQPGSISQVLTLNPGSYELSFSLSGNPFLGGSHLKSVQVSIGDASEVFSYDIGAMKTTKANMNYATETLLFFISGLATEEERRLSFISKSLSGNAGAVIGNIQVTAVPLPASSQLFLVALIGIGGFGFFRRQQVM